MKPYQKLGKKFTTAPQGLTVYYSDFKYVSEKYSKFIDFQSTCIYIKEKLNVDLTDEQEPYDKDMREEKQELVTEEIKLRERHQRFVTDRHIDKIKIITLIFLRTCLS